MRLNGDVRRRRIRAGGRELSALERSGYRGLLAQLWGPDAWQLADDQDAKGKFETALTSQPRMQT